VRFRTILLAVLIGLSSFQAAEAKTVRPKPLHKVKNHSPNYHGKKPKKYKPAKFKSPKLKKPKNTKRTTSQKI
jgi:hypothetical protein